MCDEPTARLDAPATASVAALLRELADDCAGVLTISHDHPLLAAICDTIISLRDLSAEEPAATNPHP